VEVPPATAPHIGVEHECGGSVVTEHDTGSMERTEEDASGFAPMTVVVADDHAPTRAVVKTSLEATGFIVVGEAADAASAVDLVERQRPDVVVLDVRMPGDGIAAAAEISSRCQETAVVMLTVSADDEDIFAALRVGALGYVQKGGDTAELGQLLRRTIAGEPVLHGALLLKVLRRFRILERRRLLDGSGGTRLSEREFQVLDLLEGGATTAEIANQLFIAPVTVRSHVTAICRKLNLPDREAASLELRSAYVERTLDGTESDRSAQAQGQERAAGP
jgi:two-component system, NarL family, nitrate/nitrite response regulator NarL